MVRRWQKSEQGQVDFVVDTSKKYDLREPDKTEILIVFASRVLREIVKQRHRPPVGIHVSRQSPNTRGRKRTAQSAGRVQAGDRREIRATILYHQLGRQSCSSLSLRGVGANRAEVIRTLDVQSHEEEISGPGELLGPAGGNGQPGPVTDAAAIARGSADQGRSGRDRAAQLSGGPKPRAVSAGDRGKQVYA